MNTRSFMSTKGQVIHWVPKVKVIHWHWSKSLRFNIFKQLLILTYMYPQHSGEWYRTNGPLVETFESHVIITFKFTRLLYAITYPDLVVYQSVLTFALLPEQAPWWSGQWSELRFRPNFTNTVGPDLDLEKDLVWLLELLMQNLVQRRILHRW